MFAKSLKSIPFYEFRKMMVDSFDQQKDVFLNQVHRAETDENPTLYLKAVRSTLIALGMPEDYVNGEFYEWALEQYPYCIGGSYGIRNT